VIEEETVQPASRQLKAENNSVDDYSIVVIEEEEEEKLP